MAAGDTSITIVGKGSASCRACVRGVLCQGCNNRVGQAEQGRHLFDDPRVMAYLGRPVSPGPVQDSLFGEAS